MTPESEFNTSMQQLHRFINYRYWAHLISILVSVLAAAALGLNLLIVAGQKAGWFSWNDMWMYGFLILAAAVAIWGYYRKIRQGFLDTLIDMDERLSLKDLLSTTYATYHKQQKSPFMEGLLLDANCCLKQIELRKVYPLKFSFLHVLIIILTAALIMTVWYDFPDELMLRTNGDAHSIDPEMQSLHPLKNILPEQWTDTTPKAVSHRLKSMAHAVESGAMSQQEMTEAVTSLTDEVQAHRERLAEQLSDELMGHGFPDAVNSGDFFNSDATSKQGMKQLKEEIRDFFQGEIPESIKRQLSEMEQIEESSQYLEEVSEKNSSEGEASVGETEEKASSEMQTEDPSNSQKNLHTQESADSSNIGSPSSKNMKPGYRPGKREEEEPSINGLGRGNAQEQKGSETDNEGRDGAAGVGKAQGKEKKPSDIKEASGPSFSEKGKVSAGPQYQIKVRAHPSLGKAELAPESVYRAYQQEIESVLNAEEIPLNYRQYIKNYFISIGLRKDSEDDASQ